MLEIFGILRRDMVAKCILTKKIKALKLVLRKLNKGEYGNLHITVEVAKKAFYVLQLENLRAPNFEILQAEKNQEGFVKIVSC